MYYTYMLRCEDGSIYTGITTDIKRRMEEHFSKGTKCAKYTCRHGALRLEAAWQSENRSLASKLEYYIKTLSKSEKEQLIVSRRLNEHLSGKIQADQYTVIQKENAE